MGAVEKIENEIERCENEVKDCFTNFHKVKKARLNSRIKALRFALETFKNFQTSPTPHAHAHEGGGITLRLDVICDKCSAPLYFKSVFHGGELKLAVEHCHECEGGN